MNKKMLMLASVLLCAGCHNASFTHKDENTGLIGDSVSVFVVYGYNEEEVPVHNENYMVTYDYNHQIQSVRYCYQDGSEGEYEELIINHNENGNYTGYEGTVSGDKEFIDYLIAVFNIEHLHEIENNDLPYDIDLSRLHRREEIFIRIEADCLHVIPGAQLSEVSKIERKAVYSPGTDSTEYYKTVHFFDKLIRFP